MTLTRNCRFRAALLAAFALSPCLEAAQPVPWRWTREIPASISTARLPANRTAQALEVVFRKGPLVRDVVAYLGQPDGFSQQYVHSRAKGTADNAPQGGTLRFLLANDEELHVWTGDLIHVHLAQLWPRKGQPKLVFK